MLADSHMQHRTSLSDASSVCCVYCIGGCGLPVSAFVCESFKSSL